MKDLGCEPEQFQERIIFMSMYTYITNGEIRATNVYVWKMHQLWVVVRKVYWVIRHFLDPVQQRNGLQQTFLSLEVNGTELQNS